MEATFNYFWLGVNIEDINAQIDPNVQGEISQTPTIQIEGASGPIQMQITLSNSDPVNAPLADDLDDAMLAQGWSRKGSQTPA
jgi:hypothetical protein